MENRKAPWNAVAFFKNLTATNKLCVEKGFKCVEVSGMEGMEDAIRSMQSTPNFVIVTENAAGQTELTNHPRHSAVRTVFLAMRHKEEDMAARHRCMDTMRTIFRQFCSVLIQENVRLQNENIQYIDTVIRLQEVSKYLIPGTAICMFELGVITFVDLSYNADEWITAPNS